MKRGWQVFIVLAACQLASGAPPAGYMDHAALSKAADELAAGNAACRVDVIGASRQGRGLLLITLSSDHSRASEQPALLITAGLDARHRVGTETALRVAQRLLADHADLLNDMAVYVIPCANPDGMEHNGGPVNAGHIGTLRVVDDDRDGMSDEDRPRDLNGDGFITQMRRIDPPLDDRATHMVDPVEPRLLKKPDPEKGERAVYSLYVEGVDADSDGLVAEDPPGAVDLDRNFMHRYPEHEIDAGPMQLSEPESAGLARFVLEHRNIVAAITYGRHDNLINTPEGKGKDVTGQAPKDLDEDDVKYYKEIGKVFKELTGQERAPSEDIAGSFHAWLYAQRGIPSFATIVWGRPTPSKANDEPAAAETQPATTPAIQPDDEAKPQAQAQVDQKPERKDESKPADTEAAAWLAYSDRDRNKEGFVEWTPFDHPTLGKVEIGGFVPGFQMNPPADQLDLLAQKQTAFVVELMKRRAKLAVEGPTVKKLSPGIYEVRLGVVNEGYLPTATAIARRARSIPPTIVRLSVPVDQIVAGERVARAWGIAGSGERFTQHWILRVDDGSTIEIHLGNPQLGEQKISFKAEELPASQTASQPANR